MGGVDEVEMRRWTLENFCFAANVACEMVMKTPNSLPWNLLTKNVNGHEQLQSKIRQKISKLETHLQHFPPDSVHLQIALEQNPRKRMFTSSLNLRLPSNILHSTKSAADIITAFDDSIKALLREIQSFKSDLRRESTWKGKDTRQLMQPSPRFATEPLPEGAGPGKLDDLVRDLFQQYYHRLLRHATRHIRHDEAAGILPKDSLDARELVDEVANQGIATLRRKPGDISWLGWFYRLVSEELRRERTALRNQAREEVSLENSAADHDAEVVEQDVMQRPLSGSAKYLERLPDGNEELIADAGMESPDEALVRKDLFEHLQLAIQTWPRLERDVFELHFVEGFEPDEIGMIVGQSLEKVEGTIGSLQDRLRDEMLKQAEI